MRRRFWACLAIVWGVACARALPDEIDDASVSDATSSKDGSATEAATGCPEGCEAGLVCSNGACKSSCDSPTTQCASDAGPVCVTTASDPNHCGSCVNACVLGDASALSPGTDNPDPGIFDGGYDGGAGWSLGNASCTNGSCGVDCPDAMTLCSDEICYDTQNHHDHCGTCATACTPTTEWCTQGHCCDVGTAWCGVACASILTDTANCGSCGHACDGGSCSNGACVSCVPHTIAGPALDTNISGWPDAGLRITALENTTLTGFVVNNQGTADTVSLTTTTGTVLQTLAVPASQTAYSASVSWPLVQGTSYDLILASGTNGRWVSYSSFPQSSTGLEIVDTVDDSQTLQPSYWFTFTNLVSCP